jgi:hypothetical protein
VSELPKRLREQAAIADEAADEIENLIQVNACLSAALENAGKTNALTGWDRNYKPTKMLLYQRVPQILREMHIPSQYRGQPTPEDGACDILYRLMCTAVIRRIAASLSVGPQQVYDAIDAALAIPASELGDHSS